MERREWERLQEKAKPAGKSDGKPADLVAVARTEQLRCAKGILLNALEDILALGYSVRMQLGDHTATVETDAVIFNYITEEDRR